MFDYRKGVAGGRAAEWALGWYVSGRGEIDLGRPHKHVMHASRANNTVVCICIER